ncbi:MAG: hypothetical protein EXQ87_10655 [Alphaproteobacteria bacterium]|nr:hypothetical protein [Alphaproteobacteria bacterium]
MADWSAAASRGPARPTSDRCWVAWTQGKGDPETHYCRTRAEAEALIQARLMACDGPALVGFDFPFGYPAGSGMGGGRGLAARLSALIVDGADGANNRFAVAARLNHDLNGGRPGPFWGCPDAAVQPTLTRRKSERQGEFSDHRLVDRRLIALGIQSCWKLYTTGSVGSQMLMGLPAIDRLLAHPSFGGRCRLWPFETEWDAHLDGIVVTEIWPSLFAHQDERHAVKDARQVRAVCRWAATEDRRGRLRQAFARPADLSHEASARVLGEEGWMFGVGGGLA